MRSLLLLLLTSSACHVFGQSTFPSVPPARLASYLPEAIQEFERWSREPHLEYSSPHSEPSGGYYRLQVRTITRALPGQQTPCTVTAAGILLTTDRHTPDRKQASMLIEITDFGACLERIKRDIDHFSIRQTTSGPHTIRQEYLSPYTKVRSFRDKRKGGVLKATFIIRDRYQVFMKVESSSTPPAHTFLTGAFLGSSLARMEELPHIRGIGVLEIPDGQSARSITPESIAFPPKLDSFLPSTVPLSFSDHYKGQRLIYENEVHGQLVLTLYDFSTNPQGYLAFESVASLTAEDYDHIGILHPISSEAGYLTGVLLAPDQFYGEIEGTFLLSDRQVLTLYARNCESVDQIARDLTSWADQR